MAALAALVLTTGITAAAGNPAPKGFAALRPDGGTGEVL